MKPFRFNLDPSELFIGDFNSGFISFSTQFRFDIQAISVCYTADKIHSNLMADKRSAAPILGDERKQTMFDLIPFGVTLKILPFEDSQINVFPFGSLSALEHIPE